MTSKVVLRRPKPGSNRAKVYAELGYNTGQTLEELVMATGLTKPQVRTALQGMQELGLVECWRRKQALWSRVGAGEHNDPTTYPPVEGLYSAPAETQFPTKLSEVVDPATGEPVPPWRRL